MKGVAYTNECDGDAIVKDSAPTHPCHIQTMEDYLCGCVNIDVPKDVILRILLERDVDICENVINIEKEVRDLCKADLYVWMCMGVSRKNTVADADNGWSHSDGGYVISSEDKKLFLKMANAIYEKNGEKTVGKVTAKVTSYGIKRCDYDINGYPLPYMSK